MTPAAIAAAEPKLFALATAGSRMAVDPVSESSETDDPIPFVRSFTVLLVAVAALAFALSVAPGVVAGVEHGSDDEFSAASQDPLGDANGTTEVIVRFTAVAAPDELGEPDGDGSAAVSDLREHAADKQEAFETFAASHPDVAVEREFWLANAMLVTVDADAVDRAELLSVANVTGIHENVEIETLGAANTVGSGSEPPDASAPASEGTDAAFSEPTATQVEAEPSGSYTAGLRLVDAPTAWDRFGTRGAGATVAVIDTGADPAHQDIELAGWASFDENGTVVSDDLADATDPEGHGTHVAGTVAGGNASGTHIGVAPEAELHALNTFGEDTTATFAGVVAAMEYGTTRSDADVLQMSLGASGTFRGFIAPVRNARATGAIVVAAAGNEGENTSSAPGNVYDSLSVGAVDGTREVATFSSGQPINATAAYETYPDDWPDHYVVPDVTGPGVGVISAAAGTTDGYIRQQGTSMAAPHVSGIAALAVAGTDGRVTDSALQAAVIDTAVHPESATEPDERHGHGVVDAPAAVGAAIEAAPPEPEPTETSDADDRARTDGQAPGFGAVTAVVAVGLSLSVAWVSRTRAGRP